MIYVRLNANNIALEIIETNPENIYSPSLAAEYKSFKKGTEVEPGMQYDSETKKFVKVEIIETPEEPEIPGDGKFTQDEIEFLKGFAEGFGV